MNQSPPHVKGGKASENDGRHSTNSCILYTMWLIQPGRKGFAHLPKYGQKVSSAFDEFKNCIRDEMLPEDRKINHPRRTITDEIISFIYSLLEENLTHPKKQRMNGRQIHEKTIQMGYTIGYSMEREIIADWNKHKSSRKSLFFRNLRMDIGRNLTGVM